MNKILFSLLLVFLTIASTAESRTNTDTKTDTNSDTKADNLFLTTEKSSTKNKTQRSPFTRDNTKDNSLEIIKLTSDNFVVLRGEIDGKSSSAFINELITFKPGHTVYLYLISGGGSVTSGMEIIQTINALVNNGVDVRCIANVAMSMAFVILQHCPNRLVMSSSLLMQHQMSVGIRGPMKQITTYFNFLNSLNKEINGAQSKRIGVSPDEFSKMTEHDYRLFGNQCVEENVADELVDVVCDFTPSVVTKEVESFFGSFSVKYSTCPLSRDPIGVTSNFIKEYENVEENDLKTLESKFYISTYLNNYLSGNENIYSGYSI